MMRLTALICGIIAILLGGLWLLQGMGVVHLTPLLCVADCTPLQGPSATWAVLGGVMLAAGTGAVVWSRRPNPN